MSLFGNLLTTYEMIQGASGQTPHSAEKDGDADAAKRALIPYGHTTLPVSLTVLVDANGCIRGVAKRKSTIIIPCTEESMGRTIKPVPHPLFDQLQYVDSGRSPEKTSMYLQQLAKWKGDDAKLEAVFKCVSEHSISEAAAHYGVELTDKDDKAGVCFEVQIGLEDSDLSNDVDIRNRWIAYLQRSQHRLGKDVFGEDLYTPTTNFPKKVVSSDANAKLLSANDSTNFTFRGRFSSKEQALLVDSASSQKINSTLRWLVNNHGTLTGNQAIVVWAIKRPEEKPVLNPQSGSFDFDDSFSSIADESKALHDDISDALNATNVQYAKIFSRVLRGYEGAEDLKKHNDPMVVVILDAATTGRLGVTFYCELQKDEYIKRILQWHVDAAWPLTSFKKSIVEGAERVNVVQYEGAPSFTDIINCACDTSDRSSKSYKRFAKDVKERLIECMFGGAQFPMSILNAACHKVTRPMGYDNIRVWRRDFEIACSLWKKHYIDETRKQHRQEDVITMYLEPNRDDRDYLYDLLSFNECDRSQFTNTTGGKYGLCFAQAFQTVSDNFHVIPDVTHNVVVPYGQATELLDMLHRGELSEKISVLRRLQEYTVSLFDDDYRDLARKHAISLANEDFGVFLLNEEYYNDKYGVVREAEMPLLLM